MDEPVGRTIDGTPWEEPRGPHLPDRLTRGVAGIPRISWAWIALALVAAAAHVIERFAPADPTQAAWILSDAVVAAAPFLFGAALFARHRDAPSIHRSLVVGIGLLSVVELVSLLSSFIWSLSQAADPFAESPVATAIRVLVILGSAVIGLAGLVFLGRGLAVARVSNVAGRRPLWVILLWAFAIAVAAGSAYGSLAYLAAPEGSEPWVVGYALVSGVVGVATILAWAYVATVTVGGRIARERPIGAWRFAAIGPLAILAAFGLQIGTYVALVSAIDTSDNSVLFGTAVAARGAIAIGYLALIAAFIGGLPSPIEEGAGDEDLDPATPPTADLLDIDDDGPLDGPTIADFGERPIS